MRRTSKEQSVLLAGFGALVWGIGACSTTTELTPQPIPTAKTPDYVQVPHPAGFTIGDVQALFVGNNALSKEAIQSCDADYRKLREATQSEDELRQGARELVKQDPVKYHWCFYGKIVELEEVLKTGAFIDEKQKKVLDTYSFLVPIARSYMKEFQDSRYTRWAIRHYRHLSQIVFLQKVDQTPAMTAELVEVNNPFGLWREPASKRSILEKYHIGSGPEASPSAVPMLIPPMEAPQSAAAEPAAGASPAVETAPVAETPPAVEAAPIAETAPAAEAVPAAQPEVERYPAAEQAEPVPAPVPAAP